MMWGSKSFGLLTKKWKHCQKFIWTTIHNVDGRRRKEEKRRNEELMNNQEYLEFIYKKPPLHYFNTNSGREVQTQYPGCSILY